MAYLQLVAQMNHTSLYFLFIYHCCLFLAKQTLPARSLVLCATVCLSSCSEYLCATKCIEVYELVWQGMLWFFSSTPLHVQWSQMLLLQSMYSALSGLLDGNPFSESGQLRVPDGLSNILEVLKEALKLLTAFQVHPDISLQLCAYLFFFINASLFNSLMERGKVSALQPESEQVIKRLLWPFVLHKWRCRLFGCLWYL